MSYALAAVIVVLALIYASVKLPSQKDDFVSTRATATTLALMRLTRYERERCGRFVLYHQVWALQINKPRLADRRISNG